MTGLKPAKGATGKHLKQAKQNQRSAKDPSTKHLGAHPSELQKKQMTDNSPYLHFGVQHSVTHEKRIKAGKGGKRGGQTH